MKKIVAIMLALVLALSLSAVVFADDVEVEPSEPTPTPAPTVDMNTITITKDYNATNEGTTSPKEVFGFDIVNTAVSDAAEGVDKDNMPTPTILPVGYNAGAAGSADKSKDIVLVLPEYTSVGIYTYTVNEKGSDTAGVTYYGDDITVVVTVQQGEDGKIRVAAVHTEGEDEEGKKDNFPNVYSAGSLAITKTVTGNMGDQTKDFTVTVEFKAPKGKVVKEAITYVDGTETKTVEPYWVDGKATAEITLKHGETVTFTNIPYGVEYTVVEDDYKSDGYDAPKYTYSDDGQKIDTAADAVGITNNKGVEVDTGISVDSIPYILLLAVVAIGVVAYVGKKRVYED